jgi:NADPH:quinone reductase-like Zn-dependent oxidoreductase
VVTAGTNPGEIYIREGQLAEQFPTDFPSGQGTDFAGVVEELGEGVVGGGCLASVSKNCRLRELHISTAESQGKPRRSWHF